MDSDVFVPFLFFGFLTAVIVIPIMAKEATKRSAHQLVSQAIARGQTLDADLLHRLTQEVFYDANRARRSLGNAVILLALAGSFVATGYVVDGFDHDGDAHRGLLVPAVILGSIGLAYLLLAVFDYMTKKREA
jgi:hypothetical protein